MIKIDIKVDTRKVQRAISTASNELKKLPTQAHRQFVSNTPKRSGNARNKTKLLGNNIKAGYQYATVLDKGYSKQAPRGMIQPTIDFIKRKIESIFRKF